VTRQRRNLNRANATKRKGDLSLAGSASPDAVSERAPGSAGRGVVARQGVRPASDPTRRLAPTSARLRVGPDDGLGTTTNSTPLSARPSATSTQTASKSKGGSCARRTTDDARGVDRRDARRGRRLVGVTGPVGRAIRTRVAALGPTSSAGRVRDGLRHVRGRRDLLDHLEVVRTPDDGDVLIGAKFEPG
jgi:hypothetical protein